MTTQLKALRLPDYVTLLGMGFALTAIYTAFQGNFWMAYGFIILQYAMDGLDGRLARKIGSGDLGIYLDSFADFTAVIAVVIFGYFLGLTHPSFLIAGMVFILAAGVRLSYFTVRAHNGEHDFLGIPTVFSVFIIASVLIVDYQEKWFPLEYAIALYFFFAYGMISDLRIKKL